MEPYVYEHRLYDCGAETYWKHMPEAEYLQLGCCIWAGSYDDPDDQEGLAHFFEHMPFRGTVRFPTKRALTLPIFGTGGWLNAHTRLGQIYYWARVPVKHTLSVWEYLKQVVFFPLLREDDLRAERGVVEAENIERQNSLSLEDRERALSMLYGECLGKKMSGMGTPASLAAITIEDMRTFMDQHYVPEKMTFLAVGNLDGFPDGWEAALGEFLAPYRSRERRPRTEIAPANVEGLPYRWQTTRHNARSGAVWIHGSFHEHGLPLDAVTVHRLRPAVAIIHNILTQRSFSSVLMDVLREQHSLVYSVESDSTIEDTLGDWYAGAVVKQPEDIGMVHDLICRAILDEATFSDEQIEISRESLLGGMSFWTHTPSSLCNEAAADLRRYRRIVTKQELRVEMESITAEEVRGAVARYYLPSRWITLELVS